MDIIDLNSNPYFIKINYYLHSLNQILFEQHAGRPKFKITEHPDGYSMQIGFTGYYMRIRYTDSDNSLDFNIMGYKGSVKYKLNYGNYGKHYIN